MTVTTEWYDEAKTIIYLNVRDPWSLDELGKAIEAGNTCMASVTHPVFLIMDATETSRIPQNILSYFMNTNRVSNIPKNQVAVIVVVKRGFIAAFVTASKQVLRRLTQNMYIVHSLMEAENQIETLREAGNAW